MDDFWLMGVYGHPDPSRRVETWNLVRSLRPSVVGSWFLFEDFNEVLDVSEKWGGRIRVESNGGF